MKWNTLLLLIATLSLSGYATATEPIELFENTGRVRHVVFGSLPPIVSDFGVGGDQCESRAALTNEPSLAFDDLGQPSNFGDPLGAYSAAPGMIGDFFGGGLSFSLPGQTFTAPVAAGDRILKIVENMSPVPTNRIFFNYHLFNNPLVSADGRTLDLHRYIFGFEKTTSSGNASFELRVPLATGLNAAQDQFIADNNTGTEFGNVTFALKALLVERDFFSVSAGCGVDDTNGPRRGDIHRRQPSGRIQERVVSHPAIPGPEPSPATALLAATGQSDFLYR